MKKFQKAAAVTMIAGGILAAGAGAASATGGAQADGTALHSPGVGSGNAVQVPVQVPVNVVGNTVNVVGLLNPAFGNLGLNG
ncbi:chaplin family protein [Streptomyces albidoflavus]